jgi:polyhydroxybutyrate depolymerase
MTVDGLERTFLLDVPSDLKPGAALVLGFHGYTGSATGFRPDAGFTPLTEKYGFVAAYPQGTRDTRGKTFFNVGYAFHEDSEVDDVQFVKELVARLVTDLKLDPEAVFSTGMSNGGDMSFYLASQSEPFVRTIAPVAGTMMVSGNEAFVPSKRMSVLEVHGTDDGITKWHGDLENRDGWGAYFGIDQVIKFWVDGFALEMNETVSVLGTPDGQKQINRHRWWTAADETEVVFYEVLTGKHTWPDNLGDSNVSTAEVIWQFFDRHR